MRKVAWVAFLFILSFSLFPGFGAQPKPETSGPSRCHAFVDYDLIVTLELVKTRNATTPIVNLIALSAGKWEIQPGHFFLEDESGRKHPVTDFAFDAGAGNEPYRNPYLLLRGGESVGLDLVADLEGVDAFRSVSMELGEDVVHLTPLECDAFDELLDRVAQLELGAGNQIVAFQTLNIPLLGERQPK